MKRCLSVLLLSCTPTAVALAADAPPSVGPGRLAEALHRAAPGVDREVLAMATHAMACTLRRGDGGGRDQRQHGSLADDLAIFEKAGHFGQFNTVAANFHLIVCPAQKHNFALC